MAYLLLTFIERQYCVAAPIAAVSLIPLSYVARPAGVKVCATPSSHSGSSALVGKLTDRERDILYYLPTHLRSAEIGAELFLSVNTVKSHMRAIYRKLGVATRAEAVVRARELSLL